MEPATSSRSSSLPVTPAPAATSGAVQALGYLYALVPVAAGAAVMLLVALAVNNLSPGRRYPKTWR